MKHGRILTTLQALKRLPIGWKAFFILGMVFLNSNSSFAQINRDSLLAVVAQHPHDSGEVKAYVNLYRADRRQDPDQAFQYLQNGLALTKEIKFIRGEALVLRAMGDHYMSFGDPVQSMKVLKESREIYESLSDTFGLISCLNGMGNTSIQSGDHRAALEYFLATAKLNELIGDRNSLGISFQNIGGVHYRLHQFETALEFINKALAIKEEFKDSTNMVPSLNSKSAVLSAQGNLQESKRALLQALEIARRHSDAYEVGSIQNNLGVQYQLLGKIDSAKYFYEQSLAANRRLNVRQDMIIGYYNLGEIALNQQKGNLALQYYDSSLTVAQEIGAKQFEAEVYRGLAEANKFLGRYAVAYDWLEKHYKMNDSLTGATVKMQINELQEKYESGKKDREIAELKEKEADARAIAERRKFWLLLAISLAAVVILAGLWVNTQRKAKEAQRRTELEQKALRAQMNPHFIFNSLGAIQEMYMSGDTDLANNYLGDFGKLLRKILENSGKETTTLKEEMEMLRLYLGLEKERNSGMIEYSIEMDERLDLSGTRIPPMIIQPFVENAIWHGILPSRRKGQITIRIKPTSNARKLICEIEDNGVGIDQSPKQKERASMGIHITEQRLGTRALIANLAPGTLVTLQIPL